MIQRKEYLDRLIAFKDKQLIKVVTGIRRCGKSTLLELFSDYLLNHGVSADQISFYNLEAGEYADIEDNKDLYSLVSSSLTPGKMNYIFLDEVQRVKDFQKAVDALFIRGDTDVYITGSNAFLLSGELATLLSGRYVEIKMLPLSFKEYVSARTDENNKNPEQLYQDYVHLGSFPFALTLSSRRDIRDYLDGIYDTIVLKDIISRRRIYEPDTLKRVSRFLFDNIGNLCSTKKIADTLVSGGRKISMHTVQNYLDALTESYIFYRIGRFDIKGKQYLKTGDKYYSADTGLRFCALGNRPMDDARVLENIVYLELKRRGYNVYIGKVGAMEVDFIASGDEGVEYYQVSYTTRGSDGKILERDLGPLRAIRDHCPKYLLTMDYGPIISHNGIKQVYVLDWLLN